MSIIILIKSLKQYSFLLQQTVVRELRVRYKQTFIGIFWAVLQPLVFASIFYFLFSVMQRGTSFVVLYLSMSFWMFFNNSISLCSTSIVGHPGLVTKVFFPRQVFPISFVAVSLIDLSINIIISIILMAITGFVPQLQGLLWLIPSVILLVIFTTSFGILLAGLNVFYRDIKYVVPFILQILLFITPVFYDLSFISEANHKFLYMNPLTLPFMGIKQIFIENVALADQVPIPMILYLINGICILLFAEFSLRMFYKFNEKMADVI